MPSQKLTQLVRPTSRGPVVFWRRPGAFTESKPLVLLIRGAFADVDLFDGLPRAMPEADLLLAHLPGLHSPFLSDSSIRSMAQAFDEAMAGFRRGAHVLGFSMGGLAALAMRRRESVFAVDPPLQTAPLWPLIPKLRTVSLRGDPPPIRDWIWQVFGVTPSQLVNRDYRPLVDSAGARTTILVAEEPLEPQRELSFIPGLITAEDRAWLAGHPRVQALMAHSVGHNIPGTPGANVAMVELFRSTLAA